MKSFFLLAAVALLPFVSFAQKNYPPEMPGAEVKTYKVADGDVELKIWIFKPEGWKASDSRPAAVFFFGGGWNGGSPQQFEQHCKRLAKRGMVAMTADYRVRGRHETLANICVEDARDAVRWIRVHTEELGVNPERLLGGGGSAGGHIAACLGTIAFDDQGTDSSPNATALFNPAAVLAPYKGKNYWKTDRSAEMRERMGVDPVELSPIHHVHADAAPSIIFHGTADDKVPFASAAAYAEAMKEAGARCELVSYEGEGHGFFNYGRGENVVFEDTMKELDAFLVSLGWLDAVEK
ncbi:MAG: acetyl esterase [Verrucomicrobiales bacterium]|jgi:acetyl esterase